jgi:hypothetical protein
MITILSGCLTSLHPLFTEKDLVFDPKLTGKWLGTKDGDTLIFEKGTTQSFQELPGAISGSADKAYTVTIIGRDKSINKYFAFLVKIGNGLYFDYYPAEVEQQRQYDDFYREQYIKMHSFYKVKITNGRTMAISEFDDSFLHKLIDNKQIRIKHEERSDSSYFVTASTEELQQYVMKYGDSPEAYSSGGDEYKKVQ